MRIERQPADREQRHQRRKGGQHRIERDPGGDDRQPVVDDPMANPPQDVEPARRRDVARPLGVAATLVIGGWRRGPSGPCAGLAKRAEPRLRRRLAAGRHHLRLGPDLLEEALQRAGSTGFVRW
jgi:hypothetical protein